MFIIAAHGCIEENGRQCLWNQKSGGEWESITANDLAIKLFAQGLKKHHKFMKLISCYGAGLIKVKTDPTTMSTRNFNDFLIEEEIGTTKTCFAAVFASALGQLGYNDVRVKAYPGQVFNDSSIPLWENLQREVKVQGSGFYSPSISTKTLTDDYWYDSTGKLTRTHISLKGQQN